MMDQFPQFGVVQSLFHNFVEVELNPRHTCLSKQKYNKCLYSTNKERFYLICNGTYFGTYIDIISEVKLPSASFGSTLSFSIHESQSNLNKFQ